MVRLLFISLVDDGLGMFASIMDDCMQEMLEGGGGGGDLIEIWVLTNDDDDDSLLLLLFC